MNAHPQPPSASHIEQVTMIVICYKNSAIRGSKQVMFLNWHFMGKVILRKLVAQPVGETIPRCHTPTVNDILEWSPHFLEVSLCRAGILLLDTQTFSVV